ncbi:uncharacterized protein UTRI_06271_B [Ustilago trichophora]|uniref:Uncharacterized protein n=1 Tax=Ustilago trichophora TaxID=86804 RepID=A0A5C3EIS5_9BASI|nr:uncharacterized protein UTRI_06271_B [Ustilago trichophora]
MAQSDSASAAARASVVTAAHEPQPGTYDHLPDLSADISIDTDNLTKPTFEQLNATLISRGYLRSPLNVSGMRSDSLAALSDALHAMIAQREEDIEVRTALTAKNRTLTASLERTKRFYREESERSADFERKSEASKARLAHLTTQLETERNAHRATKEALGRMRRDLQAIKSSALQYKAANDRSVARVRARIGEVTSSAIRSAVPDFQIVASAFDPLPTASSSKTGAARLYAQQVQELEQKRAHLVEYNQALKRFATEAINAARRADQELVEMVEAEEQDAAKRDASPASKSNGDASGSRSASSSSLNAMAASKRSSLSDAWLEGHRPLFQRDLFPANDTLRSTATGTLVSGSSTKTQHPALRALEITSMAISSHVQSLLNLRTERTVHQATQAQRMSAELREHAWSSKLEHDIQQDLQNDVRLSLNKNNGPAHVGSLAAAAIAASCGSSNGGASQRVDWQREKVELEKKLAQLVKQVAVAEQNAARKEKEAKKIADAERRAREMLDQASASATSPPSDAATIAAFEATQQQAESLKLALQVAEQERAQLTQRCQMLEAQARGLGTERDLAPTCSIVTSLKRLDEAEIAQIHARDQQLRTELGSLSVVAEDVEVPSLSSTADTASESAEVSSSVKEETPTEAGALSFGAGNNPELDAIFGFSNSRAGKAGKVGKKSDAVAAAAPRRSSRLSGGSSKDEAVAVVQEQQGEQAQPSEGRKRKAAEKEASPANDEQNEEEAVEVTTITQKKASRRISDFSSSAKKGTDETSPRASKRARAEEPSSSSFSSSSKSASPSIAPAKETKPTTFVERAQSRRRLSTREKQEFVESQKPRSVSGASKTPALSSRRIVSGSTSSVTRPTAASLSRSTAAAAATAAAVQASASAKRPLSNATNTREALTRASASGKGQTRSVSSGGSSIRART